MTIANGITILRLALIPLVIIFLFLDYRFISFAFLLVVLVGDLVDGAIARQRKEVTDLGKLLDPLTDKLLFASLLISFAVLKDLSWLAFILLAVQQLGLLAGTIFFRFYQKNDFIQEARGLGKAASTILSIGIILTFLKVPFYREVIYFGIALSYLAGIDYLLMALKSRKSKSPKPQV